MTWTGTVLSLADFGALGLNFKMDLEDCEGLRHKSKIKLETSEQPASQPDRPTHK